jgi:hypothetical protein
MKKSLIILALALNIAGAINMYGRYFNILTGIHLALIISLVVDLMKVNITLNNNINNGK